MRPGAAALSVAIVIAGFAGAAEMRPFAAYFHGYLVDLPVGLCAAYLVFSAAIGVIAVLPHERFAALGSLGGALLAASLLYADIVAGPPIRVPAAPGQAFVAPHVSRVAVLFPDLPGAGRDIAHWPDSATLRDGGKQ